MAKHSVPKKKTSRARGNRRYKDFQNKARIRLTESTPMTICSECKASIRAHHACPECGFYRGKNVLGKEKEAKPEAKVTTIKAE